MNKRAEAFKVYLEEKEIPAFQIDEVKDDQLNTVVFRSAIDINGTQIPTIVILDDSIYGMIRLLIAPKALKDDNEVELLKLLNDYNKKFKSFKYYLDDEGSIILDTCLLFREDGTDGDMIYAMFDVIINHLGDEYKEIMKTVWA